MAIDPRPQSLIKVTDPWVDIRAFGADESVDTNDVSLQAALNSLPASGGIVYIPTGTWKYSTASTIPNHNISIVGNGKNSIMQLKDSANDNTYCVTTSSKSRFMLKDFAIHGNKGNNSSLTDARSVRLLGAGQNILIENMFFKESVGVGLEVGGNSDNVKVNNTTFDNNQGTGAWTTTGVTNVTWNNCSFINNDHRAGTTGGEGLILNSVIGCLINNCNFDNNILNGISISASAQDITLTGCRADGNAKDGFDFVGCDSVTLNGCHANGNGIDGLSVSVGCNKIAFNGCSARNNTVSGIAARGTSGSETRDITVTGCITNNNTGAGINFNGVERGCITGGDSIANKQHGITVHTNSLGINITGNDCNNNGTGASDTFSGIVVTDVTRSIISGNQCDDTQSSPTQKYGIVEAGSSSGNTFKNNKAVGNVTAPFLYLAASLSPAFADSDETPSVSEGKVFLTNTTGVTITRFDDGVIGQEITIISKGGIVYDTSTATRLIGSSVDITTASGDVTIWVCEIGGSSSSVWRLKGFVDVSVDNSAGA